MKDNTKAQTAAVIIGIIIPLAIAIFFMIFISSYYTWSTISLEPTFSVAAVYIIMFILICGFAAIILLLRQILKKIQ